MPLYTLYLRSFAPWYKFGELKEAGSIPVPVITYRPPTSIFDSGIWAGLQSLPYGGEFHGDGRGFSLDTTSPRVTSRVNATLEVVLPTGVAGHSEAWCDPSVGPWMGVGFEETAVGVAKAEFSVSREGATVKAVIDYGASNPLVRVVAPDIDARGEFSLALSEGQLSIVATITGDQFPACESFISDSAGSKIFLGGFAPPTKGEIKRLFGSGKGSKKVWFESETVISLDTRGAFQKISGGGSGSNSTGPPCEGLTMGLSQWNGRIMGSILMPSDAP